MNPKSLNVLEYHKILQRLSEYASFSASKESALALRPTTELQEALDRLAITTEARYLLSVDSNMYIGGVHDIRPMVDRADHDVILTPEDLLTIKDTLSHARDLKRKFVSSEPSAQPQTEKAGLSTSKDETNLEKQGYPHLTIIAIDLSPPPGLIDAISKIISDRAEVLDSASKMLEEIRRELKIVHNRLQNRMERYLSDAAVAPYLQENLVTMRGGRYVIPVRSDFKGRVRGIIHDQSSSGATFFIEPEEVVEMNNRWHELQLEERNEILRILAQISREIGAHKDEIDLIVQALAELDLALMCAKYADDIDAVEPELVPFRNKGEEHPGSIVHLLKARHPLLDPAQVVPIDLVMNAETFALVITGPNTGGKTVTLKTLGLLVLMAQSGLHIPAESGSMLSIFQEVYADIGDEQSIEQSLSTFSGHIRNIINILKQADRTALVLLDELGSGTDPQEGSALARAILAHLVKERITCLVATHYPELKSFAHITHGVHNASMEFNLQTLRPTYHLTIGLPGRSNALLIAERLGLPQEIITGAREMVDPDELRADDLLDDIHNQRRLAHEATAGAEKAHQQAEVLRIQLDEEYASIEQERAAILDQAHQEMQQEIASLRSELDNLRRKLQRTNQPIEELTQITAEIDTLEETVEDEHLERKPKKKRRPPPPPQSKRPLQTGDRVFVHSLNMEGKIISLDEDEVEVQLGALRMRANRQDIQRAKDPLPSETTAQKPKREHLTPSQRVAARAEAKAASDGKALPTTPYYPSPGLELHLRGQRADDALDRLERYLEKAYLANMPFVRIVHGKGTGRLRDVVQERLDGHPHVRSWEMGAPNEGGSGVTIVHLRYD